jgi:hypothetical protein
VGDLKAAFGRTAEEYGRHRAGFPPRLVEELARLGLIGPGHDVADLGGLLAERYREVSLDVPHRTWAVVATKPRDGGPVKSM